MKKKTINAVICKKIDEWIDSIEDKNIKKIVKENTIVTGGCIASMLLREKVNDFDIYFKTIDACFEVAKYYKKRFNSLPEKTHPIESVERKNDRIRVRIKSSGVAKKGRADKDYQYFETIADPTQREEQTSDYLEDVTHVGDVIIHEEELGKFHPIFVSENAIMLTGKIQLCFRFHGTPEKIHETYDFVHCTNYWTSWNRKVILNQPALESLMSKELIYANSLYPICAMIRTRKFIQKGWTINAGQYLKIAYAISGLDLDNLEVLQDQLTGVDVAYFHQLIEALRIHKEKNKDFNLSYTYLATLIDKIF